MAVRGLRLAILALVLISSFTLVAPACGGLSEAEKHFNAGVELQEEGRLQAAIAEYDEAIRLDPELALAYINLGAAYDGLGQHERAIQDYDEAILLYPPPRESGSPRCTSHGSR